MIRGSRSGNQPRPPRNFRRPPQVVNLCYCAWILRPVTQSAVQQCSFASNSSTPWHSCFGNSVSRPSSLPVRFNSELRRDESRFKSYLRDLALGATLRLERRAARRLRGRHRVARALGRLVLGVVAARGGARATGPP